MLPVRERAVLDRHAQLVERLERAASIDRPRGQRGVDLGERASVTVDVERDLAHVKEDLVVLVVEAALDRIDEPDAA
jgi:hypothetical protein